MPQELPRRDFLLVAASATLPLACSTPQAAPGPAPAPPQVPAHEPETQGTAIHEAPLSETGTQTRNPGEPEVTLPRVTVYLAPLGDRLPLDDLTFIKKALLVFFPIEVKELEAEPLPREAFYPPRQRYRAEKLLAFLANRAPADSHVIVGLVAVDISTTKGPYEDWGILGLASIGGGECVISRFRVQRDARDEVHTRERLAKTVVHEVGHTFGLRHCPNHGCLMEDGKGSVKTTDHEYDLCDDCRRLLGARVLPRDVSTIPWPRP